jgi:uncharacterized membrane-anchored protein YhcB (DUF1043 family)
MMAWVWGVVGIVVGLIIGGIAVAVYIGRGYMK